jgi:hypothetical protein
VAHAPLPPFTVVPILRSDVVVCSIDCTAAIVVLGLWMVVMAVGGMSVVEIVISAIVIITICTIITISTIIITIFDLVIVIVVIVIIVVIVADHWAGPLITTMSSTIAWIGLMLTRLVKSMVPRWWLSRMSESEWVVESGG